MNKELEPQPIGAAAQVDFVQQPVHSDLQYVSLELGGKAYGGWYRRLADGRLQLLALANMHSERRPEGTAIEQARGMLADFVRAARRDGLAGHGKAETQSTLGELLYADKTKPRVPENDWIDLVRSIAAGERGALDQLFERTHRIVFTLMMRLIGKRDVAEELTLDVFQDVWRQAARFDAAGGSVLAWLLDQARLRALERLDFEQHSSKEDIQARAVRVRSTAVTSLSGDERQLIEAAYFSKLDYRELAARHQQSPEAIKKVIHSGMEKLRAQLSQEWSDRELSVEPASMRSRPDVAVCARGRSGGRSAGAGGSRRIVPAMPRSARFAPACYRLVRVLAKGRVMRIRISPGEARDANLSADALGAVASGAAVDRA